MQGVRVVVEEGKGSLDQLKGLIRLRERQLESSEAWKGQKASLLQRTQFLTKAQVFLHLPSCEKAHIRNACCITR